MVNFPSAEPIGQFQRNLAHSVSGLGKFNIVKIKGHTLLQGDKENTLTIIKESISQFKPILVQIIHWQKDFKIIQIKTIPFLKGEKMHADILNFKMLLLHFF